MSPRAAIQATNQSQRSWMELATMSVAVYILHAYSNFNASEMLNSDKKVKNAP